MTPTLLRGTYFALPIFVLVWNLIVRTEHLERLSLGLSAFWAMVAMTIIALSSLPLKQMFRGSGMARNGFVHGWRDFISGLEIGARNPGS